ncbi:uncharacterized protein LOC126354417 [Schistocerca gregaria]|uniref:uncharacterized protein LOC126354417 n=1 Tax=Schistocerca gregaria TaxID=7010 RepID=UPI00211E3C1E|nr:uncharacterized protein LOC126354417 [Schistocerca gregaria]
MAAHCTKHNTSRQAYFAEALFHHHIPSYQDTQTSDILPLGQKQQLEEEEIKRLTFSLNHELANKWQEFKDGLPLSEKRVVKLPATRDFHFENHVLRYLPPS